jgi:hypothetical protein
MFAALLDDPINYEENLSARFSTSKKSAMVVINWLLGNFTPSEHSHIARETIYRQYCDHCETIGSPSVNPASFGKIIRCVYPNLATRRLGTRGNSKYCSLWKVNIRYHYYGIRSKTDQNMPNLVTGIISMKRENYRKMDLDKERPPPSIEFVQSLLQFPSIDLSKFTSGCDIESVKGFLNMCRHHYENLLFHGLQGNFYEVMLKVFNYSSQILFQSFG